MDLSAIKDNVESLTKLHQIEIFRILREDNVAFNENQNGIFINLSQTPPGSIQKINNYLEYTKLQSSTLAEGESQREEMKGHYFNSS
jgi:hypothetical protein